MDENLLFGIYKLVGIEGFENGQKTDLKATAGMFVFTRDRSLSVVSGANHWVMAYTGNFEVKEDSLLIHIGSCVVRELEGTTITRKILQMDGKSLVMDVSGTNKEKQTKIFWEKTIPL